MCDIWKANQVKKEISSEELARHISAFRKLGVKHVTLSGGEALMHANLWRLCSQLKGIGVKISLLSTGVTLQAHAREIILHVDDVIVSLDGSAEIHNQIRNIPMAFSKLRDGVFTLKKLNPHFRITGRCVLQKSNFRDLPNIITTAKSINLDHISFLAADVSTPAFNRQEAWTADKLSQVELDEDETNDFANIVSRTFVDFKDLYKTKFINENPAKMRALVQYYKALLGSHDFAPKKCNAPWVSAVIEPDGEVRPCFFHKSYGNIYSQQFSDILNSADAVAFRNNLDTRKDPICKKCVCSLNLPLIEMN
jgi:MoaA/NifB/PqqE/SkfB family radical SAM enzyme